MECLYEYLCNNFNEWLVKEEIKRPVVVWTDWHESRLNYHLAKTLFDQQIILYGLPPNSTHFLQPLDVAVFKPMKDRWRSAAIRWQKSNPEEALDIKTFAPVFMSMYNQINTDSLRNGFKACGLHPFDRDAPDYTKITTEITRADSMSLFDGIDQGMSKIHQFIFS